MGAHACGSGNCTKLNNLCCHALDSPIFHDGRLVLRPAKAIVGSVQTILRAGDRLNLNNPFPSCAK
eukprot:162493-Amphidinium_carterae.1